ncbi:MAG: argininosuccinate lyase [Gemmatimonadales bacterium]
MLWSREEAPAVADRQSGPRDNMAQMWGGRFAAEPAPALVELNGSLAVDHRLWPHDVRAAKAWVAALGSAGVLGSDEEAKLVGGLDMVANRLAGGAARGADDEDIHSLIERLLYEEVGDLAGKLNTGRSRNDQVATDLRLWCMEELPLVDRDLQALGRALVARARDGLDLVLPGYTHQQPAQPIRWAHVLLAHAWPLARDRGRIVAALERASELPLGSGALAGSAVVVDREFLRDALGFRRLSPNALDATGDRDFALETVFDLSLLATHLSRLAGELITYASSEYGFIRLADQYCTGSSLLPQKRNPDALELARGKAARLLGDLTGLMGLLHGLPAGYSKDLQEDKALVFDAVDNVRLVLPVMRGVVETMEPVPERMEGALEQVLLSTDVADAMVLRGVPFREAHALAGKVVRAAEALDVPLTRLPDSAAASIHPALPAILRSVGGWSQSIERRATAGGSSKASLLDQIKRLQEEFPG